MHYPVSQILAGALAAYIAATMLGGGIASIGFPLPEARKRIGCVDGLRGYLALSVMVYHFVSWLATSRFGVPWAHPGVRLLDALGPSSVNLFFMTTGFVFYPRILQGLREGNWPAIYVSRLFRIMPMIAFSLASISAVILVRVGPGATDWHATARAMAQWLLCWGEPPLFGYADSGRMNATVLWSLWYEWLFYLIVLPACALAMDLRCNRLPTWIVPAGLLAVALASRRLIPFVPVISYLPMFAAGMIAFEIKDRSWIGAHLVGPGAAALVALALLLGAAVGGGPMRLACHAFAFVCVACGNSLWGILRTKGSLVLGECSYGVYLLHGLVLDVLFVDFGRVIGWIPTAALPALLPVAALIAVAIAALCYVGIERPCIRVGSMLVPRRAIRGRGEGAMLEVAP